MPLRRDSQYALSDGQRQRVPRGCVPVEGSQRGETSVAAADAVMPVALQVLEEREEDWRVQLGQRQRREWLLGMILHVTQQQTKCVAIAGDGARAGVALCEQVLAEEVLEELGERQRGRGRRHRAPSGGVLGSTSAAKRSAACASKSGEAVRYQYVSVTCAWPRYVASEATSGATSTPAAYQSRSRRHAKVWRRS